jgi:hypothetical protein
MVVYLVFPFIGEVVIQYVKLYSQGFFFPPILLIIYLLFFSACVLGI